MYTRIIDLPKNNSFFLFGPRQTGKSTLLKSLFSTKFARYYDLLQTEEYTRLSANPVLFRQEIISRPKETTHIILNEIQRIPELLNEVHWLLEQPSPPIFVLTGSSARKLKRIDANLLGGLALTYKLHPLVSTELNENFSLDKTLAFGTLPHIYSATIESAVEMLRSYTSTYLQEEIEREAKLRSIGPFVRFLQFAAQANGQQINYSNIARDIATTYKTIQSYYTILEDTLIGQFIFPYNTSYRKSISCHPKFYFFDTGVVRALCKKLQAPLEPHTPEFGLSFEHFIYLEMTRVSDYHRSDYRFSFYRSLGGAEVDFIVETPQGEIHAVEVKARDNVEIKELRGLRSFQKIKPKVHFHCVSLAPYKRQEKNITIWPWQEFLKELF